MATTIAPPKPSILPRSRLTQQKVMKFLVTCLNPHLSQEVERNLYLRRALTYMANARRKTALISRILASDSYAAALAARRHLDFLVANTSDFMVSIKNHTNEAYSREQLSSRRLITPTTTLANEIYEFVTRYPVVLTRNRLSILIPPIALHCTSTVPLLAHLKPHCSTTSLQTCELTFTAPWGNPGRAYLHPHISVDSPCLGQAANPIRNALTRGDLFTFYDILRSYLGSYNNDSPHCYFHSFNLPYPRGRRISSEEMVRFETSIPTPSNDWNDGSFDSAPILEDPTLWSMSHLHCWDILRRPLHHPFRLSGPRLPAPRHHPIESFQIRVLPRLIPSSPLHVLFSRSSRCTRMLTGLSAQRRLRYATATHIGTTSRTGRPRLALRTTSSAPDDF